MYIHDILTQMEEKINILYAEDNTTAAMIYTEILEEAGYTVPLPKKGTRHGNYTKPELGISCYLTWTYREKTATN